MCLQFPTRALTIGLTDKASRQFDMEKLADALQQLQEDDLLKVVQMVHEHKTNETYVKNDVERMVLLMSPIQCLSCH